MRDVLWFVPGAVLGAVVVLLTGLLEVQAIGQEGGAAFDVMNRLVGVTSPRSPWMPVLAEAVVGAVGACLVIAAATRLGARAGLATVVGFVVTVTVMVVAAYVIEPAPTDVPALVSGQGDGWVGWLLEGGTGTTAPTVALVVAGEALLRARRARRASTAEEAAAVRV